MNNYTVYMHISPSGKRYIGITCQEPKYRWGRNGNGYKRNIHFTNAINKYGWDNFQHIIVTKGLTEVEAKWLEIELIREWDSSNKKYGYNLSLGGENGNHSEETKKKISEALKGENNPMYGKYGENHPNYGKKHSEETKKKISENHANVSGENNPNYGVHHSEETRKKMSKSKKGKNHPRAKSVICITTNMIFSTVKEGTEYYVCDISCIVRCCKGRQKYAGKLPDGTKLVWRYIEIIEL